MRVYQVSKAAAGAKYSYAFPKPGTHPESDPREWFARDGVTPRTITVRFHYGVAEVSDALGRYLIATKKATLIPHLVQPNVATQRLRYDGSLVVNQ
ncbi:hypothetical protein [Methylosinus sp. PW1]|uniref:hypothetical protein n=1 Tax=Methylosinus sp. PW1 TaxID=107636 RepID=UPI0005655C35|nr:hypothetical protein [Methylosinus sp. PW1]